MINITKPTFIFVFTLFLINCTEKDKNYSELIKVGNYVYEEYIDSTGTLKAIIAKSPMDTLIFFPPRPSDAKMTNRQKCFQICTASIPGDNHARSNCYNRCYVVYPD